MAINTFLAASVRGAGVVIVGGVAAVAALGGVPAAQAVAEQPSVQLAGYVTAGPVAPGCKPGFVWRDARDGDGVCVTPAERDTVHLQNADATTHLPGSNGCRPGYVWRDAWDGDGVCVTPAERDIAHKQNAEGPSHSVLAPDPVGPSPVKTPSKPKGDFCINDGTSSTGTPQGSNPTRYQSLYSPALGVRWNSCTHVVTVYFNGDNTNDHFNLLVNGKQRELAGARGAREYSMPDSQFGAGFSSFAIQSCRSGGLFAPSVCTNWSPTVRVPVNEGEISQS